MPLPTGLLFVMVANALLQTNAPGTPPIGITTPAVIVRVVDGDTVDVAITTTVRVRLLDCWAPEMRAPGGEGARGYLMELLPVGSQAVMHIPTLDARRVGDVFTFGRVLARVYANGVDVSKAMVLGGHATYER